MFAPLGKPQTGMSAPLRGNYRQGGHGPDGNGADFAHGLRVNDEDGVLFGCESVEAIVFRVHGEAPEGDAGFNRGEAMPGCGVIHTDFSGDGVDGCSVAVTEVNPGAVGRAGPRGLWNLARRAGVDRSGVKAERDDVHLENGSVAANNRNEFSIRSGEGRTHTQFVIPRKYAGGIIEFL